MYVPTGEVNTCPSAHLNMFHERNFALPVLSAALQRPSPAAASLPHDQAVVLPARQAYSHWASVGRRAVRAVLRPSHLQNSTASFQLTQITG